MTLPYVVVRSNNLALSTLDDLTQSGPMTHAIARLDAALADEKACRQRLIDVLYRVAGQEPQDYRFWLNIKAKLGQNKINDEFITRHGNSIAQLESGPAWLASRRQLSLTHTAFLQCFENTTRKSRVAIRAMVQNEAFRKSISFTRGDIAGIVRRYCQQQNNLNKKALNDEDTLIRYLTRAIAKVSPFSGFTSIGFARLDEQGEDKLTRQPLVQDRYSLDRSVFLKIYDKLVMTQKAYWRYRFSRNFNQVAGQTFCYSFRDDSSIYPFRSSLVKSRIPMLSIDPGRDYSAGELRSMFGEKFDDLFKHLIVNGILQFDQRLDDQARDIIQEFKDRIIMLKARGFDFPVFEAQLDEIHRRFQQLEATAVSQISNAVDALTEQIHALGELVGYRSVKRSGIVYHDTLHPSIEAINKPVVNKFAWQISEFITHYTGVNYDAGISTALMQALRKAMSPQQAYSLFEFYDLAADHLRQGAPDPRKNVGEVSKLLQFYEYLWQHKDSDNLILDEAPTPKQEHTMAAYGHVDGDRFILNCVDGGYLRVWSRFFTFNEDNRILDACVDAYEDKLKDAYDFYDTFGFNTGRRPRLAQKRIWLEGTELGQPGDLSLKELYVRWPSTAASPKLYSARDHREVTLRHTALFVSQLYPKLLEILMRFSMMEKQSYFAPRFGIYDMVVQRSHLSSVKLPRVVYKDIVVSRRQWWLKKSLIPVKAASESLPEYLLRLDRWRHEMGMPERIFIRRHAKDKVLQRDISNNKKPLFIDFHSPIMCRPLSRLLNSDYDYISFEEMLPDAGDDFMKIDGQRYASEIIFEKVA